MRWEIVTETIKVTGEQSIKTQDPDGDFYYVFSLVR